MDKATKPAANNTYELLYIVSNQYTEDELTDIRHKVDQLINQYNGSIGYQEFLGKKKLAYPINKVAHGYYVVTEFELDDKTQVEKLDNLLKLDNQILRHMIIIRPKTQAESTRVRTASSKPTVSPEEPAEKPKTTTTKNKVSMEKLDEKLDEILNDDTII